MSSLTLSRVVGNSIIVSSDTEGMKGARRRVFRAIEYLYLSGTGYQRTCCSKGAELKRSLRL